MREAEHEAPSSIVPCGLAVGVADYARAHAHTHIHTHTHAHTHTHTLEGAQFGTTTTARSFTTTTPELLTAMTTAFESKNRTKRATQVRRQPREETARHLGGERLRNPPLKTSDHCTV